MKIIGRLNEIEVLKTCIDAKESKLVAVYGRRRVGKTFLIRNYYAKQLVFDIAGLHNGNMKDQLTHFIKPLKTKSKKSKKVEDVSTWMMAFEALANYLDGLKSNSKKVIFIDELPWFDTPRSKFLMAFENFWNSYCTKRTDLIVVICGSAASWMINKIMKNKGGLHNRVSERIKLNPFTLLETEKFLKSREIIWSKYDITKLYMTIGGIPFYLNNIHKGQSVTQFIDNACFTATGALYLEFQELYASLFSNSNLHYNVIKALVSVSKGVTRNDIIRKSKISGGGTFSKVMEELCESGFVTKYLPFDNNVNLALYRLTDFFTIFYLKFMHNSKANGLGTWATKSLGQSYKSWSGFAFESVCMQHVSQIKKALQLTAIYTETSSWKGSHEGQGAQIDLLFDRADSVINIFEIKFNNTIFTISKTYAKELRNKIQIFSMQPQCINKNIFLTMLTVNGIANNTYAKELVQNTINLDDLFN